MRRGDDAERDIADLRERVLAERCRAERAAGVAASYEERAAQGPASLRRFRLRMAELHRRSEARHLVSARLQAMHANRLQEWVDDPSCSGGHAPRPTFISAVAVALDAPSTTMTLAGVAHPETVALFSDRTAQAARDLELVLGEGPITDATATGSAVVVEGPAVGETWSRYGPAVAELGVLSVVATPLRSSVGCLGALCTYDGSPRVGAGVVAKAGRLADALTLTVLAAPDDTSVLTDPLRLFDDTGTRAVVHQAAGMVSVHADCRVDDAVALLRARAFTEGVSVDEVAERVVSDGAQLF